MRPLVEPARGRVRKAIEYLLVECGPQILARHLPAGGVTITSAWRWRMASTIW
jgi:hypothetical protein